MTEKFHHWLPQLLGVHAIAIGSTVYYQARTASWALRRHEAEHVRQWRRGRYVGFVLRYLAEYLLGRLLLKGHRRAYLAISYEVAARNAECRSSLEVLKHGQ